MSTIYSPSIILSFRKAVITCLHPKIWLAFCVPIIAFVVTVIILGGFLSDEIHNILTFIFQRLPWIANFNLWMDEAVGFAISSGVIWLATVLTVIMLGAIISVIISSFIVDDMLITHIYKKSFSHLEAKGVSLKKDVQNTLYNTGILIATLLIGLPLWFFPPVALAWQLYWTRYFFSRTLPYDALCDYASDTELKDIMTHAKPQNEKIGLVCGLVSYIPSASIVVPIFAMLWFGYHNFAILEQERQKKPS